jgi:hypothetical protein
VRTAFSRIIGPIADAAASHCEAPGWRFYAHWPLRGERKYLTVDDLKRIAPPTARATANGLRVLSLFLLLVSISAGQSAELVTQPPQADAVSPGAATALPSICDKPIPIADEPSAPLARLRCVQDAGGLTRLELSIPGRAALPLTGAAADTRPNGHVKPEPWSLSLRRLAGPPPLYWLRYLDRDEGEDGTGGAGHWHDLVWRADAAAPVLVDAWTLASDRFSHVDLHADQAESLRLDYRPPTLWVTRRRADRTAWEVPGLAPYRCAEDCAAHGDPQDRALGAPACRRDCELEHRLTVNRVTSLQSQVQRTEVPTGLETPESTAWAKLYEPLARPGNNRPGGRALLILDDGAAGWLLVPLQVPDLSPAGGLDPAAPGPIPALASCWLYNHRTRLAADAGHPYPPASAEQVRADHAAPADCCTVESSPDGRRILVFGTPAVPQPATEPVTPVTPATPPRQLLALYDVTTRQCWSANLAVDGQLGRAPYDGLGDPVFSPDGRHLGYRARRGDARFVVVDDREGTVFQRVGAPVFSTDGRHSAYWARDRGREFIVFDGTPGRTWTGAGAPVFSPAGGPPAYRAQDAKGWRAVVADTPGSLYDDIGWFNADATGRTTTIADLVFSAKGELAYAARTGNDWFMVRDHRHDPAYDQVGLPVFSPDGTRLAFRARRNERDFIVLDGRPEPEYDQVGTPVFSANGRQLAYWAADAGAEFVVWGGRQGPRVATPGSVGAPVFADAGETPVYLVRATPQTPDGINAAPTRLWSGDRPLADLEVGSGAVLNRVTGAPAWWDSQGADTEGVPPGWRILSETDGDPPGDAPVWSPDGNTLAFAANRDGRARMQIGATDDGPFDAVADPVFSPTGDRLAYRARLGAVWFPIVAPLAGSATTAGPPATAPLVARAPRLLQHAVAIGQVVVDDVLSVGILGGSARGRWYGPEAWLDETRVPTAESRCAPLGPDWIDPTLRWRLYGTKGPLSTCTGGQVSNCPAQAAGPNWLSLTLPDCDLKESTVAVAGEWNAMPRRPRRVTDSTRFEPMVRRVLEGHETPVLPVGDVRVDAIDLDGDRRDEYLIRSTGGTESPTGGTQYSMLLLAHSDRDPAPTVLCDWQGPPDFADDCTLSHFLDLDGDGTIEIVVYAIGYEGWEMQVFTLQDGKPVKTPLNWGDGT